MKDEKDISIHALLAESDHTPRRPVVQRVYFYPRSPCGERLCTEDNQADFYQFLSTLSLRRATAAMAAMAFTAAYFYPRSPCGERPGGRRAADRRDYFYPRSPCGERPGKAAPVYTQIRFLSTLSLRRATPPQYTSPESR